jgi:hypothetical protein
MTTPQDLRYAHELIDTIADGKTPTHHELERLRRLLPDRPEQKTLPQLAQDIYDAWACTDGNEWPEESLGELEAWLSEFHAQLEGLNNTAPELPAGMFLADHNELGRVVVSPKPDTNGQWKVLFGESSRDSGTGLAWVETSSLTMPDKKPAHPEYLASEADYRNAPGGTIVVYEKSAPFIKWNSIWRTPMHSDTSTAAEMGTIRRRVLRYGFGDE